MNENESRRNNRIISLSRTIVINIRHHWDRNEAGSKNWFDIKDDSLSIELDTMLKRQITVFTVWVEDNTYKDSPKNED